MCLSRSLRGEVKNFDNRPIKHVEAIWVLRLGLTIIGYGILGLPTKISNMFITHHIVADHRSIWCSQNWSIREDKRLSNRPYRNLHFHCHCSWRMFHNFFVAFFIAWGSHSRWMSWNWSPLWIQKLGMRCYGMDLPKNYFSLSVNHTIPCVVYLQGEEKYEQ